jgi:2-polyprenyl-3-methyl-5-hydroxy-6-metoxy-1,4-benzoquinol methylase
VLKKIKDVMVDEKILERFKSTTITPWKMNKVSLSTKVKLINAIERGDIVLLNREFCLCGSHKKSKIASIDRFGLNFSSYICTDCGVIFTNPYISKNSLPLYYNEYYHPLHFGTAEPIENLFSKGQGAKIFNFVKAYLKSSSIKIFELGAGCGTNLEEFVNVAKKNNFDVVCYGSEYNKDYVEYGNKKGLKLTSNSIEEYANNTKNRFDLIILSHVFEHLTDPFDTLNNIKKISHKGTMLYIEVPGVLDLKTRYVYNCDFLKYLTHAHTFNYSLSSLKASLNQCGFELIHGNEKVESIFRLNRNENNSFNIKDNNNYTEILSYLTDLESNLVFYQSKNPAHSIINKLKRKIKSFVGKFIGKI